MDRRSIHRLVHLAIGIPVFTIGAIVVLPEMEHVWRSYRGDLVLFIDSGKFILGTAAMLFGVWLVFRRVR